MTLERNRAREYRLIEAELRRGLELRLQEPFPRHLHFGITDQIGPPAPVRLRLPHVFLTLAAGRGGDRFDLDDMVRAVTLRFGAVALDEIHAVKKFLCERVLPFWRVCGYVQFVEDGSFRPTGLAAPVHPFLRPVPPPITPHARRS